MTFIVTLKIVSLVAHVMGKKPCCVRIKPPIAKYVKSLCEPSRSKVTAVHLHRQLAMNNNYTTADTLNDL